MLQAVDIVGLCIRFGISNSLTLTLQPADIKCKTLDFFEKLAIGTGYTGDSMLAPANARHSEDLVYAWRSLIPQNMVDLCFPSNNNNNLVSFS